MNAGRPISAFTVLSLALLGCAGTPVARAGESPFTPTPKVETVPTAVPAPSVLPPETASPGTVSGNSETPLGAEAKPPSPVAVEPVEPGQPPVEAPATPPETIPPATEASGTPLEAAPAVAPQTPELVLPTPVSGADLFKRLGARLSQPVCPDSEAARRWRKRYAGHPGSFARHLTEILPLLDFVSREIEASGLPAEFAFIPIVESWYRPEAIGVGGPAGMWQMIASTARNHGIHIQSGYDGRLSPVESTRAALSYLKTLHGMFSGDWQAAVMAYNAGEYRLLRALKNQGERSVSAQQRKPRGLSAITYDYVSKLQALSCLMAEPAQNGVSLPLQASFMPLVPILVASDVRQLDQLAAGNGVGVQALRRLNPGYTGGRLVPGVPRLVLMPVNAAASAAPASTATGSDVASEPGTPVVKPGTEVLPVPADGQHEVRSGDTLWSIARRYGLSLEQLRRLNRLGRGSMIRTGQSLRVQP